MCWQFKGSCIISRNWSCSCPCDMVESVALYSDIFCYPGSPSSQRLSLRWRYIALSMAYHWLPLDHLTTHYIGVTHLLLILRTVTLNVMITTIQSAMAYNSTNIEHNIQTHITVLLVHVVYIIVFQFPHDTTMQREIHVGWICVCTKVP
jgi:hypothetical protein